MKTTALSLIAAYQYGREHGLEDEISEIQSMQIDGFKGKQSVLRRGYIVNLFKSKGIFDDFIEKHWEFGKTVNGKNRQERLLSYYQQHQDILNGDDFSEADNEEEEDQKFAYEAHLRDFLAKNLNIIEPGLVLFQSGEVSGVEYRIEGGRIDILAVDANGDFVVIELKLSGGRNRALGQLLYYMGWVDTNMDINKPCRGVIVAADITDELMTATKRVDGVSLYQYKISMSLDEVAG